MGAFTDNELVRYHGANGLIVVGSDGFIAEGGAAISVASPLVFSPDNTQYIGSPDGGVTFLRPVKIYVGIGGIDALWLLRATRYGGVASQAILREAQGTEAAPTATQAGDTVATFGGAGFAPGGFTTPRAMFQVVAMEAFTAIAQGASCNVQTTPIGSIVPVACWWWTDAGHYCAETDNNFDIGTTGGGGGKGRPRVIYVAKAVQIEADGAAGVTSGLCFVNQTNGAAGNVGTLANAPTPGNPTFWIPVNVGGVLKHVPAW